jgi:multiple sugar transport system permease protein
MAIAENWALRLAHLIIILLGIIIVIPFIWMVFSAFKPPEEIQRVVPTFLPEKPTLRAFKELFTFFPFATYFRNSILVSMAIACITLFTSSVLGYCFAKHSFFGRNVLYTAVIILMILPFEIVVVPLFDLVNSMKMTNTLFGLILPFVVEPFGIFLCAQFLASFPPSLMDAARIDGVSEWGIYFRIVIPTMKAALSVLFIFVFLFQWGFVLWPLVVVNSENLKTVALGITLLQTQRGFIYHQTMAAALLTIAPTLIVFFIMRKNIVQGMVLSGMKI